MERRQPIFGLDVVRAAAVVLVMASHCGGLFAGWYGKTLPPLISYGAYYGIELFFVLSGLLIGGLLIRQIDRPDVRGNLWRSWRIFMTRRWLRTLPLYYLCLAVLSVFWAPIAWIFRRQLLLAVVAFGTMLQNLAWPMVVGNFFDVTWSLAVEEWFYLGFSALLFVLVRLLPRRALTCSLLVFLLVPPAIRWWLLRDVNAGDHMVPFWLDQIALGVVAAWVAARRPGWFRAGVWLLPVCLLLVGFILSGGLVRFGMSTHWRRVLGPDLLGFSLLLCLPAAAAWRHAAGPAAAAVRALSRWSYALYLIHLTITGYVSYQRRYWHLSATASVLLSLVLILSLAWALSRFVERPIMARRPDDRIPTPSNASNPNPEATQAQAMYGGA